MILITGVAGFIGFHTTKALLSKGIPVIGIDNINDYYDTSLKNDRLAQLKDDPNFEFHKVDLSEYEKIQDIVDGHSGLDNIIHLGAQAGVRYSLENPFAYSRSNLTGHLSILEIARKLQEKDKLKHLVYASSSSVYGGNTKQPFSVDDPVNKPVSLYASTKRANELMTQSYSHLYRIPATGLRFFTVYGPWGRPDMAYFKFTKAMYSGKSIDVYNNGDMMRDFTYIDDIVDGIFAVNDAVPSGDSEYAVGDAPHRVFNLGHNKPENLDEFVKTLERLTGCTANINYKPMQPGDVKETYADIDREKSVFGFEPKITLEDGLSRFVDWFKDYYKPNIEVQKTGT